MRRMIRAWMALILALSFATIAAAQGTGRVSGEILDREGKPYPDVNVEIKNPDTGPDLYDQDGQSRAVHAAGIAERRLRIHADERKGPPRF